MQGWIIIDKSNQKLTEAIFDVEYFAHEFLLTIDRSTRQHYSVIEQPTVTQQTEPANQCETK
ncbi:hypothetical protein UFOVP116_313 [uncultured Caudovirales phage]|uniref:Uncharacterized protein n=1 Tax=uncultured Caudovirales phage TaxID=2100421 RepID=A0A6J5LAY2_9CAUD|nr:hypothetical protein UFOVP116_313 [uncultured Caudovirales phage]